MDEKKQPPTTSTQRMRALRQKRKSEGWMIIKFEIAVQPEIFKGTSLTEKNLNELIQLGMKDWFAGLAKNRARFQKAKEILLSIEPDQSKKITLAQQIDAIEKKYIEAQVSELGDELARLEMPAFYLHAHGDNAIKSLIGHDTAAACLKLANKIDRQLNAQNKQARKTNEKI